MEVDLAKLGRFIANDLNLQQLRALCRDLGIPHDNLVGASQSAKAFDLVTVARDRGQLSTLVELVARVCPDTFDPKEFVPEKARRRIGCTVWMWLALLAGAVLVVVWATSTDGPVNSSEPTALSGVPAASAVALLPSAVIASATPEPSRTIVATTPVSTSPTPSPPPSSTPASTLTDQPNAAHEATATARPSATPLATQTSTATEQPTDAPSPTWTPTVVVVSTPSPTPQWPSPAFVIVYDEENRTLTLAPGDADRQRARLCTPLHPYFSTEAIYFIDHQISLLRLRLPAKARIRHAYVDSSGDQEKVLILDVRRHPIEGFKITGEAANMIGCDLTLNQAVRRELGFPLELGEFDDPLRFDHGWVTIEFIDLPADTP